MSNLETAKERLKKKAKVFQNLFSTPDGKKALEALQQEFDSVDIMSDTPEKTAYRLGQRDVVKYIEQMIQAPEKME